VELLGRVAQNNDKIVDSRITGEREEEREAETQDDEVSDVAMHLDQ
jgi:hypothetical protein